MSKSFLKKGKEFYLRYEDKFMIAFIILFISVNLIGSFFLTFKVFQKPITNEQVEYFKEVAYDVYHEGANILYESDTPYDVSLSLKSNKIRVRSASDFSSGVVIATPENGTLIFEHEKETIQTIVFSILLGIIVCLGEFLFVCVCLFIQEELLAIKDVKVKNKNKRNNN